MANSPDADNDDDFSDLYKEYTGPVVTKATSVVENVKTNKRSHGSSDDEEEPYDPNAIPTDFTSREKKVWDAKSKATERNWKKKKEEEMICKLCGESGHFTQGCPSTLGTGRKSQDFFERFPARENHVKALFTEKVIEKVENDIGCKIKMEEKFIIVSGKDRLILKKGVDALHKIKEEGERKGSSGSRMSSKSRSPPQGKSPVGSLFDSRRPLPSPQNAPQFQHRFNMQQEKVVEDRVHDDLLKTARGSPSARAYGNDGARGRSSCSKSPARHPYNINNSYNSFDGHSQNMGGYKTNGRDFERRGLDLQLDRNSEQPVFLQTLEELEREYLREATELHRVRDKEEDEENNKHREAVREMRENCMKKLSILRGTHRTQWVEFLQQTHSRQQLSAAAPHPSRYDAPSMLPMGARENFPNAVDNNYGSSRHHDNYGDYPRQTRREYGNAYNRY